MKGRKPKPTRLRVLGGNAGHRKINENEPRPDPSIPDAPQDLLTGEAKSEWDRLTDEMGKVNLLTQLDRGTLAAYCVVWARWLLAERMVKAKGTMLVSKTTGQVYPSPWLQVANRAADQLTRLGALLGLDPSSRTRLEVKPPSKGMDVLQELINRGKAR